MKMREMTMAMRMPKAVKKPNSRIWTMPLVQLDKKPAMVVVPAINTAVPTAARVFSMALPRPSLFTSS